MNTTHTCIALVGLALCRGAALGQGQPPGESPVSRAEYEALKKDFEALRSEMAALREERKAAQRTAHPEAAAQEPTSLELERLRLRQDMVEQTLLEARYGESNFHLSGFAFTRFTNVEGSDSSFTAVVAPIILWELSDRLLFETELEFGLETEDGEGKTEVELEYAHASYILNDYVTLGAGKFLTPFGIFGERLHPAWINKLPDGPLAFGHGGLVPMSSLGAYARGGFPIGEATGNYAFYVSNGPSLVTEGHDVGGLNFENFDDINNNKAFGGRVGFLPLPEVEIGYSFQFADVTPSGFDQQADALLQSIDLSYVTESDLLGGLIDLRFEWVLSDVDDVTFVDEHDGEEFTFNNERNGGYVQLAFRPTKSDLEFLRDMEFVGRYGWLDLPSGAEESFDQDRWTLGVNYWLNPSTVLKIAFEHTQVDGGNDFDAAKAMFAIGF